MSPIRPRPQWTCYESKKKDISGSIVHWSFFRRRDKTWNYACEECLRGWKRKTLRLREQPRYAAGLGPHRWRCTKSLNSLYSDTLWIDLSTSYSFGVTGDGRGSGSMFRLALFSSLIRANIYCPFKYELACAIVITIGVLMNLRECVFLDNATTYSFWGWNSEPAVQVSGIPTWLPFLCAPIVASAKWYMDLKLKIMYTGVFFHF
jgi:hypothetical protein